MTRQEALSLLRVVYWCGVSGRLGGISCSTKIRGLSASYSQRSQPHSPYHRVARFLSYIRAQASARLISSRFYVAPAWLENAASSTPGPDWCAALRKTRQSGSEPSDMLKDGSTLFKQMASPHPCPQQAHTYDPQRSFEAIVSWGPLVYVG